MFGDLSLTSQWIHWLPDQTNILMWSQFVVVAIKYSVENIYTSSLVDDS